MSKTQKLVVATALAFFSYTATFAQMHDHSKMKMEDTKTKMDDKIAYACPMKCEVDKTYEKEGSCPKCGMDLIKKDATTITQEELVSSSFTVYGNCGMCQNRIEKAALSLEGVKEAKWDSETKILSVKYSDAAFAKHNTSIDSISLKIAEAGHDTQFNTASEKAYKKLPGCCQYERPSTNK